MEHCGYRSDSDGSLWSRRAALLASAHRARTGGWNAERRSLLLTPRRDARFAKRARLSTLHRESGNSDDQVGDNGIEKAVAYRVRTQQRVYAAFKKPSGRCPNEEKRKNGNPSLWFEVSRSWPVEIKATIRTVSRHALTFCKIIRHSQNCAP
jgi:hypothetical protein